ncbi:MAG: hypothetical protein HFI28_01825 [Lachnospiraceae bacterium]|nr:hypothetical protein [Lachnospiraceae bacterium]
MKRKWKDLLKKAGLMLLLTAMLAQAAGAYAYAGAEIYETEYQGEEYQKQEKQTKDAQSLQNIKNTKNIESTKNTNNTKSAKNIKNTQDTENTKNIENAENTEDTETAENTENTSNTENTNNTDNTNNTNNTDNTDNTGNADNDSPAEDKEAANTEKKESEKSEDENNKAAPDEKTEEKSSDTENTETPEQREQFHFRNGDVKSVQEWMRLYLPGGYDDILSLDQDWWDTLYDYEKDLADFIRSSLVELDPKIYSGQDLDEIISILEQGASPAAFFEGTIFQSLELSDLYALRDDGRTLDQVYEFLASYPEEDAAHELDNEWMAEYQSLYSAAEKIMTDMGMTQAYSAAAGTLEAGDIVANLSVSASGYSGTGHGTIYKLTLGGEPGLCLNMGRSARNGYKYFAGEGENERRQNGIGYLLNYASLSGKYYATVQIAAWLYLESGSLSQSQVMSRAASMLNTSTEEAEDMAKLVWGYYQGACSHSIPYYVYRSANGNAQTLGVRNQPSTSIYQPGTGGGGEEPELPVVEPEFSSIEDSIAVSYEVRVRKTDWQTGVGLKGCMVDIFENGKKIASVTTDANGEASYSTSKSASFQADYCSNYGDLTPEQQAAVGGYTSREEAQANIESQKQDFASVSYTYGTREVTAPTGYVWQANEKSGSVSGNGSVTFDLTNERTLGSVELIKYDTESESGTAQGEAELDGAVYGIYAAENISHRDGKTGRLLRKDELAATATVGRTPRRNADGYILNTDGSRHIENPRGAIAYENTPGRTAFGDLELGSYYIKEITPAPGYMLDEAIYSVTFTYKNQMTKVEVRNERASDADNELTVDDRDTSHTVYSGDYVIKQGIKLVKTSDNGHDTELSALEGAGFSVYLIQDLLGVKNGTLTPLNGVWGSDDIKAFYDYDFTKESKAIVYKRTNHEQWTAGDEKWLTGTGIANQYQVAEMFTDKDGCIETPELPFGTYVVVETTTPENHVMARPFIVHITQDGGVLYTDAGRRTIEKTYTSKEGIRYGDHKAAKEREGRLPQKQRIINNTVTKAYLRIIKADEEFLVPPGTYVKAEELVRGTVLKEGAQYRLRCLSPEEESLKALNWMVDAQGYLSYYYPGGKLLTGTKEHPYETSFLKKDGKIADCYITLPQKLPVGTYELTELTAPEGYVINGAEQAVNDTSTENRNSYELVETPKGKTVFTIENGSVYPDGQMGINKYALCDAYGNLTVTVLQKNQEQKGILEIYKHGEQVSGANASEETLLDKLADEPFRYLKLQEVARHQDAVFTYGDAPVEGASFQIVAAEDIYSQELDIKLLEEYGIDTAPYRIWRQGDVVAEITTDRSGFAYAAGLYIGKYKIRETVAGSGFVLNTEEKEFAISPQKQTVSFDIRNADYKNERQRLNLNVVKKDKESGENLAGAVYGLYAGEDICTGILYDEEKKAWIIREKPEVLFAEGTLIATCITDSEGKAVFDEDLPLGQYEIRELEAPLGYLLSEEVFEVDGSYEGEKGGQDVKNQEHVIVLENQITRVRFQKLDMTNGRELAGALLEVWELPFAKEPGSRSSSDSAEVKKDSWISTGPSRMVHMTEGLQLGRTYAFREARPAPGYVTAEDIYFRLEQLADEEGRLTDEIGVYVVEQPGEEPKGKKALAEEEESDEEPVNQEVLIMEDDITKVQISKKDIATNEELPGALLELYDEKGALLETWVSTDTPHYIERLPIGTYRLVEKQAPEGFGYAEDVIFRVLDTDEIQTVEMKDGVDTEPDKPDTPEETPKETPKPKGDKPESHFEGPAPEASPQEVNAPELGDRNAVKGYVFILVLFLAAIAAVIFQYKRDVEE